MLVNIIQNTISSFISAGEAAAHVITTNLKMWLGFETSVANQEKVVDGDFPTGTTAWDLLNGATISNNKANIIGDGSTFTNIKQTGVFKNGKIYKVVVDVTITSGLGLKFQDGANNENIGFATTTGVYTFNFTGTSNADLVVGRRTSGTAFDSSVNNISIKELTQITPDKSGNNNVGELFTGKALYFDGTTFYLDVTGFSMSGNNATFSFWANIEDIIKGDYFFDFHSSTTRFILGFGQTSQKLAVYSGGWHDFGDPPQDQWVRIVLTVKGTIAKCFVNGVQLGTDKTISTYDFSSATTTHIGARYTPETIPKYYEGLLSDFQVYDKVWLNDDIAYDYANPQNLVTDRDNTTIALSNLKAYWAMSEGAGSITYDSSGEGNNGIINGATYEPAQPRIPQLGMMNWSKGSNLVTHSENFSDSSWTKLGVGTGDVAIVTSNFDTSPIGTQNATRLQCDLNGGTTTADQSLIYDLDSSNTSQCISIYMKSNNGSNQNIYFTNTFTGDNRDNAIVTTDWQRFEFKHTTSNHTFSLGLRGGTGSDDTADILIWGAQSENSSSVSAYRLTDGAATLNSTVIPNPTIPTKDIFGNLVRDRLNSFNLDGSGYAEVADDTDLDLGTGDFSVETWVRFEFKSQGSSLNTIYSNGEEVNDTNTFSLVSDQNNKIGFYVNGTSCFSTSTFSKDDWVHVVGTRIQGTNGVKLYINGNTTPEATATNNNTVTNSFDKTIGYDTHSSRYYNNIISDVRVYSQALTSDEVENNYNAGLSAHTN